MKKLKEVRGITLISLVVTIIVLLILAGISFGALTGDNGILNQAENAKEQTEIDSQKEILDLATINAMQKDRSGSITEENLLNELIKLTNGEDIKVTNNNDGTFLVIFVSGRVYYVKKNGDVEYLREKVIITADKESNSIPQFVQNVELTVTTVFPVEDSDIAVLYAWTTSKEEAPTEGEFIKADLTGTKLKRTAIVSSTVTATGNYYLWVKAISNEKETIEIFGEYAIREYTTLKTYPKEINASSYFLGSDKVNTNITRNAIRSITIENSLQGYSVEDLNCWDVSAKQDESILAKYEETTIEGITYYDIKIAGDGGVAANPNSSYLFAYVGYNSSQEVTIKGLENLDTSLVNTMVSFFSSCNKVKTLDVGNFDTSNVTNMNSMFFGCSSLTTLKLNNFETKNVTNMNSMFRNCTNLNTIELSNFDTRNVTNMDRMFQDCKSLTVLDVSNFNTNNVTGIFKMFFGCSSLTVLDVSKFNTSKITDMQEIFSGCSSLTVLDVSNFNTSNVTSMTQMFYGCSSLTSLDVSKFNTSGVTSMREMFCGCSSLTLLDVSKFNTSGVTSMRSMFNGCSSLTALDVSNFNTSNVINMGSMFRWCSGLTTLDVSSFDTSNVTDMNRMFRDSTNLSSLDISSFVIKEGTNCLMMFANIPKSITIYVGNEDMKNWVLEQNSSFTNVQVKSSQEVTE